MKNLFDVKDQVVVITGGTGVLGKAIALHLAEQGARVVILGRKAEVGEAIVAEIKAQGGEAMFLTTNVLDEAVLEKNLKDILAAYGRVDALLNAAGGNMPGATIGPDGIAHYAQTPAEFAAQERLPQVAFVNAVEKEGFPRRQRLEASRAGRERRVLQRSGFAAMRAVSDAAARQTETASGAKQRSRKALLFSPDSSGSGASGSACPFCASRRSRREERRSAQGTAALIQP